MLIRRINLAHTASRHGCEGLKGWRDSIYRNTTSRHGVSNNKKFLCRLMAQSFIHLMACVVHRMLNRRTYKRTLTKHGKSLFRLIKQFGIWHEWALYVVLGDSSEWLDDRFRESLSISIQNYEIEFSSWIRTCEKGRRSEQNERNGINGRLCVETLWLWNGSINGIWMIHIFNESGRKMWLE